MRYPDDHVSKSVGVSVWLFLAGFVRDYVIIIRVKYELCENVHFVFNFLSFKLPKLCYLLIIQSYLLHSLVTYY